MSKRMREGVRQALLPLVFVAILLYLRWHKLYTRSSPLWWGLFLGLGAAANILRVLLHPDAWKPIRFRWPKAKTLFDVALGLLVWGLILAGAVIIGGEKLGALLRDRLFNTLLIVLVVMIGLRRVIWPKAKADGPETSAAASVGVGSREVAEAKTRAEGEEVPHGGTGTR